MQRQITKSRDNAPRFVLLFGHLGVATLNVPMQGASRAHKVDSLFHACTQGRVNHVRLLLDADTDVNAVDVDGFTALHFALLSRRPTPQLITLLLERGAAVNAIDNFGCTPLHYAAEYKVGSDIVTLLLEHSADVGVPSRSGRTPCDIANADNNQPFLKAVEKHLRREDKDGPRKNSNTRVDKDGQASASQSPTVPRR